MGEHGVSCDPQHPQGSPPSCTGTSPHAAPERKPERGWGGGSETFGGSGWWEIWGGQRGWGGLRRGTMGSNGDLGYVGVQGDSGLQKHWGGDEVW